MELYPYSRESYPSDPVVDTLLEKIERLAKKKADLDERATQGLSVTFAEDNYRTFDFNASDGLHYFGKGGQKIPLSWGDMQTSVMFGFAFCFGQEGVQNQESVMSRSYVNFKLDYISSEYERIKRQYEYELEAYLQSIDPINARNTDAAYAAYFEDCQKKDEELSNGKLAEKMLTAFLIKETQDNPRHFYAYEPGPIEDIEYKNDIAFMGTFADGRDAFVGLQFTTDGRQSTFDHKIKLSHRGNFKRTHDEWIPMHVSYVLASEEIGDILIQAYVDWRHGNDGMKPIQKCNPQGPLSQVDEEQYERISEILKGLYDTFEQLHKMTPQAFADYVKAFNKK